MDKAQTFGMDDLRAFAAFNVVLLHASATFVVTLIGEPNWWIGNMYDSLSRFCIPVFLMLSGALILPKTYDSIGIFLKKRLSRIFFPFLLWSFIYIIGGFILKNRGVPFSFYEFFTFLFSYLIDGKISHLWYVYLIIGLYLFFPIISKWIINSTQKEVLYFLIIWGFTTFLVIPLVNALTPKINLTYFSGYIGFPILGYYLSEYVHLKKRLLPLLLFIVGFLTTLIGTSILTTQKGSFSGEFYEYLAPNVILCSVAIFILFKNITLPDRLRPITNYFSDRSYGIYLAHPLLLFGSSALDFIGDYIGLLLWIPLKTTCCFIIAAVIISLIRKLPYGKYISG